MDQDPHTPESRRISYIEDREVFENLKRIAAQEGLTVAQLIQKAVGERYGGAQGAKDLPQPRWRD